MALPNLPFKVMLSVAVALNFPELVEPFSTVTLAPLKVASCVLPPSFSVMFLSLTTERVLSVPLNAVPLISTSFVV